MFDFLLFVVTLATCGQGSAFGRVALTLSDLRWARLPEVTAGCSAQSRAKAPSLPCSLLVASCGGLTSWRTQPKKTRLPVLSIR
jgi:hypothetical protein